jgi:hypothetical protein
MMAWYVGPNSWSQFQTDDARLRYARYLVARYSAFNVVFVLSGEWDQAQRSDERKPLFLEMGQQVMSNDPHNRVRSIHPCKRRVVEEIALRPWMSFGDYRPGDVGIEKPHSHDRLSFRRAT